jgi:hypothetical protein
VATGWQPASPETTAFHRNGSWPTLPIAAETPHERNLPERSTAIIIRVSGVESLSGIDELAVEPAIHGLVMNG